MSVALSPAREPARRPSLGVVIIAKNEEGCLARCLESVAWADEIIVVDDCSTDRTPEIARSYGCRVLTRPMTDFAQQRAFGLSQAGSDWVLHLDADEACPTALRDEILAAISDSKCAGFRIELRNRFLGRVMKGRNWAGQKVVRLGRRALSRWTRPVHERLEIDGPVGDLHTPMEHYSEPDYATRVLKSNRYTSLEAALLAERGVRFRLWRLLLSPAARALHGYVVKGGFRDGLHGIIYAGHVWWGNFAIHVKLWEQEQRRRTGSSPQLPERSEP